jgi:hypothetical protein
MLAYTRGMRLLVLLMLLRGTAVAQPDSTVRPPDDAVPNNQHGDAPPNDGEDVVAPSSGGVRPSEQPSSHTLLPQSHIQPVFTAVPVRAPDRAHDTSRRVGHMFIGFNAGGARSYGHDEVCPNCATGTGFVINAELGKVFAKRFALLVDGSAHGSPVEDDRVNALERVSSFSLMGAVRIWPHPRVWLQAGLGVGIVTYGADGDGGAASRITESLGQGFVTRGGAGFEVLSFARVSFGVSFVVDGFFQSSTSIYTPIVALSLRYYTGLGSSRSRGPCNFDPSKGCTN